MTISTLRRALLLGTIATLPCIAGHAMAATEASAAEDQGIAEGSNILVTATRVNEIAPVTASLQTTQPQAIISRSFIEDSLPATADFNQIALISPSVSNFGGTNGAGLSESKAQIRGFQDAEYNITYDGVPFGDTNDPSHHSNTFFPSNTIETLVVDRGPGNASNLGIATFGGSMNLFSRATREDASAELKGSYGTWNTWLTRAVLQSGAIKQLGGTEIMLSGQHVESDGARSYSPFRSNNIFGKIMIPISPDVKLTLLGTYNENRFNQPDKDGATLSQVALYGKNFSLNNDPGSQTYYGYNHTHKTTDFEIVKLEANIAPGSTFENRAYTYSYDNETLSGNDVTLFATATPVQITNANTVTLTPGGKPVFGVPGYTKTNKYRVWGDIAKVRLQLTDFATLTAGLWLERANTYRQQRDVDLITMSPNYIEKKIDLTKYPTGTIQPPANIKFDQDSHTNHSELFTELELRPLPGLTITPGFKHVDFERRINAAYNQTTRFAQNISDDYQADLPFLTANYAVNDRLSVYGQFAKGFLAPPLSVLYVVNPQLSSVEPQKSTNYQAGFVYHGSHLSLDADVYYINFNNKFFSFNSPVQSEGTIFINAGKVVYKGVEGQVTYAFDNGFAVFANASRNYAKTNNDNEVKHTQIANAPMWTAAGGVLFKQGPVKFSLIDKYTGPQYAAEGEPAAYRIAGYNSAILSARYEIGPVRIGVEVNDLFNSTKITNINQGKTAPYDQYFYQPGRSVMGDVTITF
ncbi:MULTISPECIES: TonB-dependent receptor [unclassified Sphingobium]|uniref:TonB-dependent receptor n=1 Tax=unclassified Sphingobium TaxID=2611147 RepID=UPI0007701C5B|nr:MULTISPECIES: TonB-dependent receptor [unclassified Sphingobium]AMK22773.1 TonB-dependent outer membrane receptor FecA5 [Sphingobium sp. TKS]NML90290.1 TonB-dependent receptor [Sphingobium sp. TB-6]